MISYNKKYYYLYKTTNLINGKYYIGVRCTNKLKDGYIGCGVYSQDSANKRVDKGVKGYPQAVKKYGYNNFKKEILYFFTNGEDAYKAEEQIVTNEVVSSSKSYNRSLGGRYQKGFSKYEKYRNTWISLYEKGLTMSEIGEIYGLTHNHVRLFIPEHIKKCNYRAFLDKSIKVKCLNNNKIYSSIHKAALDIFSKSSATHGIKRNMEKVTRDYKGYRFEYV